MEKAFKTKIKKKSGYVLVTVIAILSLAIVLITRLAADSTVVNSYANNNIDRVRSQQLAFSGIEIVKSIIFKDPEDKDNKKQIKEILKYLNRWQSFEFEKDNEKYSLEFYISSEDGKCNINNYLKFGEKQLQKNIPEVNLLSLISKDLGKYIKAEDLYENLKSWAKERKYPVNELSELLEIKDLSYFKDHFYVKKKTDYALTDIFSLENKNEQIQPLLLSKSMIKLLGFKNLDSYKEDEWNKTIEKTLDSLSFPVKWEEVWDKTLADIYGKKWKEIHSNYSMVFANEWNPVFFSVIVYATYKDVTSSLYAIVNADKTSRLYLI